MCAKSREVVADESKDRLLAVAKPLTKLEEGKKVYICTIDGCGRKFASKQGRKEHRRRHSGDKPYECPFINCDRRFKWRSSLASHKKTHGPQELAEPQLMGTNASKVTKSPLGSDVFSQTSNLSGASTQKELVASQMRWQNGMRPLSPSKRENYWMIPMDDPAVLPSYPQGYSDCVAVAGLNKRNTLAAPHHTAPRTEHQFYPCINAPYQARWPAVAYTKYPPSVPLMEYPSNGPCSRMPGSFPSGQSNPF